MQIPRGTKATRIRLMRWGPTTLIVFILATLSVLDRRGLLLARPPDANSYHLLTARVTRVIDGDTLVIDRPDPNHDSETTRVRLWGIDCPESAHPGPPPRPAEPFAEEATEFVRNLVEGQFVTLRLEPHRTRDRYGRLLAHVDLQDGTNLAIALLQAGLARDDDRWVHSMIELYHQQGWQARRRGAGFWDDRPASPTEGEGGTGDR